MPASFDGKLVVAIPREESFRDVFERDAGICQYCNEDLLWSYSIFSTTKFDRIPAAEDGWVTCCEACHNALKECAHSSFEARKAFVQQHALSGIEAFRATAERIRANPRGLGIVGRLVGAGLLRNDDVISLEHLLPSFLQHHPGDLAYQAIVYYSPTRGTDVIYLHDESLHRLEFLTFAIFQQGHVNAPYRKTRFSWGICPADHWATKDRISLTELQVKLDWDDLQSDEDHWSPDALIEEAKAALPVGEQYPVSFLQRRFRLGYARTCRLYQAIQYAESPSG